MQKLKKGISLFLSVVMLLLTGCTLPGTKQAISEVPESTKGEDLTMAPAADSVFSLNCNMNRSFNPLIATNHSNQLICSLVYENMVEVDNNFEVIPNVITEWECNSDATSWVLTIDTTKTFHDGTNVTANDVRYSIERAIYSDRYSGRFRAYGGGAADGDDKLNVTLNIGDTQFIKLLNIPVIKYGSYDDKYPTGSGPYTYVFQDIELIEITDDMTDEEKEAAEKENADREALPIPEKLVAYEGYEGYEDLPVDTVYIVQYTQPEDIINAFEDSYIDVVINDPSSYTNLGYAATNEVHTYATTNMHFVGFNQESKLGEISGFRFAMQYAFDREYLVDLLNENAVASAIPMYPTDADYPTELNSALAHDMSKVRTVLENNGFHDYDDDGYLEMMNGTNDDLTIEFILCSDSSAKAGIVNRFKEDMLTIGVKVDVQELTWEDYYAAISNYEDYTEEQLKDEDFEAIDFDMYYAETKLRNNFDISELLQERTEDNRTSNINFTRSTGNAWESYMYSYLASGDTSRKQNYYALCEYVLTNMAQFVVIGFEKQQIITHRGVIRGIDANMGNPLYGFPNWTIQFADE